MKVIYSVFYKRLKSYDGNDVNLNLRIKILDICKRSYELCNSGVNVIFEYVDDIIENTALMYFDKMRRIKELNKNFDVLWVDGDTLCLEDVSEVFGSKAMKGTFWGWWDGLNGLNGGVVYYPKRYLYDNWDFFEDEWIRLLSECGSGFIGPYEQMPITNLYLRQFSREYDYKNYSLFENDVRLMSEGLLFDIEYNYNPIVNNRFYGQFEYNLKCNSILKKKILHLNMSIMNNQIDHFFEYTYNNLIGYTGDDIKLLQKCNDLKISNSHLQYYINDGRFIINNNTYSFIKIYFFKNNHNILDIRDSVSKIINPGHFMNHLLDNDTIILIKNIMSGESTLINY
jgi:hypothetical protein